MTHAHDPSTTTPPHREAPHPAGTGTGQTGPQDPFKAIYRPYDKETLEQLVGILDTRLHAGPVPAGQMLLNYLESKRRDGTCVTVHGPSPRQLNTFLNTDAGRRNGLLLDQTLVYENGHALYGGIYISVQSDPACGGACSHAEHDTLQLSSHT